MPVPAQRSGLEDKNLLDEVVRQSLARELERRRELRPNVQLGVPVGASEEMVRAAFARLCTQYLPERYERHGTAARLLAAQILMLLEQAHALLLRPSLLIVPSAETKPRSDETLRAIETLHRAVERRYAEGLQHRDAGRLADAMRSFESVLALDRHHAPALDELRALRAQLDPPARPGVLAGLVARIRLRGPF